jgi:hypothetical protein
LQISAACRRGAGRLLVTANKRHFPDASYGVTRVASAGELLDWIALEL